MTFMDAVIRIAYRIGWLLVRPSLYHVDGTAEARRQKDEARRDKVAALPPCGLEIEIAQRLYGSVIHVDTWTRGGDAFTRLVEDAASRGYVMKIGKDYDGLFIAACGGDQCIHTHSAIGVAVCRALLSALLAKEVRNAEE